MLWHVPAETLIATSPGGSGLPKALFLLVLTAAVGFAIVFAMAMISASRAARRTRERAESNRRRPQPVDAWAVSALRVSPEEGDHWLPHGARPPEISNEEPGPDGPGPDNEPGSDEEPGSNDPSTR